MRTKPATDTPSAHVPAEHLNAIALTATRLEPRGPPLQGRHTLPGGHPHPPRPKPQTSTPAGSETGRRNDSAPACLSPESPPTCPTHFTSLGTAAHWPSCVLAHWGQGSTASRSLSLRHRKRHPQGHRCSHLGRRKLCPPQAALGGDSARMPRLAHGGCAGHGPGHLPGWGDAAVTASRGSASPEAEPGHVVPGTSPSSGNPLGEWAAG